MAEQTDLVVSPLKAERLMEETLNYWSAESMAEAEPIFIEISADEAAAMERVQLLERPDLEAQENASVAPAADKASALDPQPTCPATGSNTEQVPNRRVLPYCTVGKLFMTFDGANFVGSAWTIAGSGVFTAGHCVFDSSRGGWADNLLFVPQYHDGAAPLGRWTFNQIASLRGWTEDRDFRFDMAAFKTDRPIQPSTGSLGWMANYPPNQGPYTGLGYPAAHHPTHGFNGQRMWRSTGNYRGGSNPIQVYNDMTGGCSGGPWAVWKQGDVRANGLNSFRYTNDPTSLYSPHFGEGFLALYNWVR